MSHLPQSLTVYYSEKLPSVAELAKAISRLSPTDQVRANAMTNPNRRVTFVSGRLLLSVVMQINTGYPNYRLTYDKLGKPHLVEPDNISFSLSHSESALYLLVDRTNQPCGIDAENIKNRDYSRLMNRFFNEKEKAYLKKNSDPLQSFYQIWTQREAKAKQYGRSVFSDLNFFPSTTNQCVTYQHQKHIVSISHMAYEKPQKESPQNESLPRHFQRPKSNFYTLNLSDFLSANALADSLTRPFIRPFKPQLLSLEVFG